MTDENKPAIIYPGYSLLDEENLDAVGAASAESQGEKTPILKLKKTGHLYRYRILPPSPAWAGFFAERRRKPTPFFFVWKHLYEDENGKWVGYNCPRRNPSGGEKRECPDCERFFLLRSSPSPADQKRAKEYTASRRVMMNVIDREEPGAGPKILELSAPFSDDPDKLKKSPPTQWQKLEKIFRTYKKDIADPSANGWDVTTLREGEGQEGTNYDFGTANSQCVLSDDPEQAQDWILNQPDLPGRVAIPTDDDIRRILKMPALGGRVSQMDPSRQLAAGPAGQTAGDIIDAELAEDDWD